MPHGKPVAIVLCTVAGELPGHARKLSAASMTHDLLAGLLRPGVRPEDRPITGDGKEPLEIYQGKAAFEPVDASAVDRTVYCKKGAKDSKNAKHYVEDGFGRFTRRYPFVEAAEVFVILMEGGALDGRGVAWDQKSAPAFVSWENEIATHRETPAGSASRHRCEDEGYLLGTMSGVRLTIDLARVPKDDDSAFLNLSSGGAQRDPRNMGLAAFRVPLKAMVEVVFHDKLRFGNPKVVVDAVRGIFEMYGGQHVEVRFERHPAKHPSPETHLPH